MTDKILTIVTNAHHLHLTDGTEHPSGYWAEELAVPVSLFREQGYAVDIATIDGVAPTVDASSMSADMIRWVVPEGTEVDFETEIAGYGRVIDSLPGLRAPLDVGDLGPDALKQYAGLYIAGGHGCMTDMPSSHQVARLLLRALELDLPIGSVCHGPTAFLAPRDAEGKNPFAGYRFTCFSQTEETLTPIWGRLPMVIEYELSAQGMQHSKADVPWGSHVVRDRKLVTGQNPHSSRALAEAFLEVVRG